MIGSQRNLDMTYRFSVGLRDLRHNQELTAPRALRTVTGAVVIDDETTATGLTQETNGHGGPLAGQPSRQQGVVSIQAGRKGFPVARLSLMVLLGDLRDHGTRHHPPVAGTAVDRHGRARRSSASLPRRPQQSPREGAVCRRRAPAVRHRQGKLKFQLHVGDQVSDPVPVTRAVVIDDESTPTRWT